MGDKVRIACEWLGICSGCEIAILDLHEGILPILEKVEFVHIPVLVDVKEIPEADVGIISGCIENEDNIEVAKEMREKCKIIVALGSCACFGGIPGLRNLYTREEVLEKAYVTTKSTVNPDRVLPRKDILELQEYVKPLNQVIKVDYYIPGCPPPSDLIGSVLTALLEGKEPQLPTNTVCDECPLKKERKAIPEIRRWCVDGCPEPDKCMLEQGFICLGPVTRAGCGAKCPSIGVPCRGCMGPTDRVIDQGAKMISALGSIWMLDKELEVPPEEYDKLAEQLYDPVGMLYRFTLPGSLISRRVIGKK